MTPDERSRQEPSPLIAAATIGVFACALLVTVAQPLLARDAPVDRFVAALQASRALVRPGDTVLVHPPWRDDVVAVVRSAETVTATTSVTEAFSPRHGEPLPSLVVVADAGWTLPAVLVAAQPREVGAHDGIVVFRIDGGAAAAANGADVARASVHVQTAAGVRVGCPWDATRRRHVCTGLPGWMTVGEETLVIRGRRERCIWAHPTTDGAVIVDFGSLPTTPAGWRLSLALSDQAAANPAGAAVTATLAVDEAQAAVTVQHDPGFRDVVVARNVAGATARVVVRVTTPDDGQRHTCFRLEPASGSAR
jgi:hypothetical protein